MNIDGVVKRFILCYGKDKVFISWSRLRHSVFRKENTYV